MQPGVQARDDHEPSVNEFASKMQEAAAAEQTPLVESRCVMHTLYKKLAWLCTCSCSFPSSMLSRKLSAVNCLPDFAPALSIFFQGCRESGFHCPRDFVLFVSILLTKTQ